ncbi:hypothetical protein [Sphingopyxis sp. R3-92]|uniref:hypothetical protein n=1 Tax=Sphingopyxis sp. R3-92 TaxID=3158553 RepID=UPI003EE5AE54
MVTVPMMTERRYLFMLLMSVSAIKCLLEKRFVEPCEPAKSGWKGNDMKRLGLLLASGAAIALYAAATNSQADDGQAAAGAEASAADAQVTTNPAPEIESFGKTQFVLSGDPVIPPRDYSKNAQDPREEAHGPIETGRVYDILFGGIEGGRMQFDVRGYAAADPERPASSQRFSFPVDQTVIELRDITIEIDAVEAGSLTFRVRKN